MSILVTGGTGTVGLAIVECLVAHGERVTVYAESAPRGLAAEALESLSGDVEVVQGDVRDGERLRDVLTERGVRSVVHGAAITPDAARERAGDGARTVIDVNCIGAVSVFQAFADTCPGRFVHLGSIAAYGAATTAEPLLREEAGQERPENLYEITKFAGELAVLRLAELRGREAVSLRLGDVFGCWEHRTDVRDMTSAPFQTLALALRGGEAVLPRDGRKAWVYTADVAEAVRCALEAPALPDRVVNVSSPFEWSIQQWCELLALEFPGFRHRIDAEAANVSLFADNAPMSLERAGRLGFTARYDLRDALRHYVAWAAGHREFFADRPDTADGVA
ncbi:NAD-dependent epimerase/dehydratase family protein [Microbacterium sp. NPDC003461]